MAAEGGGDHRRPQLAYGGSLILLGLILVAICVTSGDICWSGSGYARAGESRIDERLVPTRAPLLQSNALPVRDGAPDSVALAAQLGGMYSLRQRIGVGAPFAPVPTAAMEELSPGWYLDWSATANPLELEGIEYMPMVRLSRSGYWPSAEVLVRIAAERPGSVWLIGNEPDVIWQDNVPPDDYARLYHELYGLLKKADSGCQVAIGGVSQPTPLRLAYLEAVLASYRVQFGGEMPVDVWNVHAFILREEAGSWGVDIPPGSDRWVGELFRVEDHDDMAVFRRQIEAFRQWMKAMGQQNKPLIVSEYGIVMPAEYGFPPEQVQHFLLDTFDYFLTAQDQGIGYPLDDYRLVQRWCWFSLADEKYPTGNLIDRESGELTPIGETLKAYVQQDGEPDQ